MTVCIGFTKAVDLRRWIWTNWITSCRFFVTIIGTYQR